MEQKLQSHIIELLKILSPDIPELEWLLYLVEQWSLDDDLLANIENIMQLAVQQTNNQLFKDKLQKSINLVALIRSKEPKPDETELDQLLQSIL